jgi:hypothetical protein
LTDPARSRKRISARPREVDEAALGIDVHELDANAISDIESGRSFHDFAFGNRLADSYPRAFFGREKSGCSPCSIMAFRAMVVRLSIARSTFRSGRGSELQQVPSRGHGRQFSVQYFGTAGLLGARTVSDTGCMW